MTLAQPAPIIGIDYTGLRRPASIITADDSGYVHKPAPIIIGDSNDWRQSASIIMEDLINV